MSDPQALPSTGVAPDWQAVRREFPALDHLTYLNIAQKAAVPRKVEAAIAEWMADVHATGGATAFSMSPIEDTRRAVANTFGMPHGSVALIKNTSEGMNIVAQGFPWRPGDNVVISSMEHENNTFPWRHLKARGVEVRIAEPDEQGRVTLASYEPLVDARTRVLAVGWVVYGNGYRADLPALAAFCKSRGVRLVVDGIQAVGILATPIQELGVDVLVAGGHKAQLSLAGAGFLYATPEMIELLQPPYAAKFSFESNDRTLAEPKLAADAHRFEYGNPNFLGCWVQKRSAEWIASLGLANIEARVKALTTRLIDGAEARQIRVRTPRPWSERAGIVSFDVGNRADALVASLQARNILVSQKDGHLRASLHFYNDEADVDRFLDAVAELGGGRG
ncbi:MAG: aminotransferase class V-fold PLP-dependent enzyme [Hyphomicrobiaceae bacterium]|nr:aminotransferase class V-fold PLP-dependent enzyme [Hyphomicrobiaceae bacterium]